MLRDRLPDPRDEEGTSMVEVMVGLAMGMVVLAGLAMLLIVVMRGNARIGARAEASDNARVAMTRIMEELHSACARAATPPILSTSGERLLAFESAYGVQAGPSAAPVKTELEYVPAKGAVKGALIEKRAGKTRTVISNVSQAKDPENAEKVLPVFYYANSTSEFKSPQGPETLGLNAGKTIFVRVAFKVSPKSEPVADAGAATEISNNAVLRLTPPTYRGELAKPCE
jgi:Tfp pilus assembly protein PilW